jgi:light-regulated signal transduction histidine kinase (bacteriophytochrome)
MGAWHATAKTANGLYTPTRSLEGILQGMTDAETGERGYILTGDHSYLVPYQRGLSEVRESSATVRKLTAADPQGAKYLARIHEAAFKMSRLIDDMLRLAKVGRQGLRKKQVPLRSLVDEVLAELGSAIEKRVIDWRITALPVIDCDYGLMKQVFANLISNAVKYTRPIEKALIEIGQSTIQGRVVFFVRDNGVGFDMRSAAKLFAPFRRLHQEQDFEGTGIGLATVQRILEKHRGRI